MLYLLTTVFEILHFTVTRLDLFYCAIYLLGNISAVPHSQLIPLPKQFSELPAISVKCQLSGVRDSDDGRSKQMAIHQIQVIYFR